MFLCHYWSTPHCFLWVCCLWSCQVVPGSRLSLFRARRRHLFPSAWSEGKASARPVCLMALTSPFPCSSHCCPGSKGHLVFSPLSCEGTTQPQLLALQIWLQLILGRVERSGSIEPQPQPLVTSCQQGHEMLSACWCLQLATCLFSKVH